MMRAADIATALRGRRSGRQFVCKCPAHNDASPSLLVFDGHTDVQVRCLAGCAQDDVINALKDRGLWDGRAYQRTPVDRVSHETKDSTASAHRDLALQIWDEAVEARGTLAETYLWQRGLDLPVAACLRFHERCPRGRERVPALVVLMTDLLTYKPIGIQRIFLTHGGAKDGKPMMLGPTGHGAMMLSSKDNTFTEDLLYCPKLYVCEGCETGIALWLQNKRPIWALGSAGAIMRFPVLFGVGELVICADHDPVGLQAAEMCGQRWADAGIKATMIAPGQEGADFADDAS